jgi:glycosyltransferase involved in cell wall biosynthesis
VSELAAQGDEVVVVTRSSGRLPDIEALGARTRPFDFHRGSVNVRRLWEVRGGLAQLINDERPDVVHAIAMQTMVMTSLGLATCKHQPSSVVLHLTGLGYLGQSRSPIASLLRPLAQAALRHCMMTQNVWLIAENDDDLAALAAAGCVASQRTAIVPGAGVDPVLLSPQPLPANETPRVAFIGRMLVAKGVQVLVDAHRILRAQGVQTNLALYGDADPGSRQAISSATLSEWNGIPGVRWHGRTGDVVGVWAASDIAVVPAIGGDGMPRAMLEAAACGRPLVVTDASGCREFVRQGIEGLVVPSNDSRALANAIAKLAGDAQLRARMGAAARERVLAGYTTRAVREAYRQIYLRLPVPNFPASQARMHAQRYQ